MSWLWLAPLLALVVTWVLGRYNARAVERDWEMMLTAKGRGAIEALELQVLCDGAAVESARIGALTARDKADFGQATRLAGLAYRAVEEATPDRLKRLRMAVNVGDAEKPHGGNPPLRRALRRYSRGGRSAMGSW